MANRKMYNHHLQDADDTDDGTRAGQETREMHPQDIALRAKGFRIEHRKPGQEPVWSYLKDCRRVHVTQAVALRILQEAEAQE